MTTPHHFGLVLDYYQAEAWSLANTLKKILILICVVLQILKAAIGDPTILHYLNAYADL
eukprot:c54145_g1_i1 orf=41-217(-)